MDSFTWITPATRLAAAEAHGGVTVGMLMPAAFPDYARVLHPYWDDDSGSLVTWSSMAERTGATMHAEVQWHTLVSRADGDVRWNLPGPEDGSLEPGLLASLLAVLLLHTESPNAIVSCFWSGFGDREIQTAEPVFSIDERDYVVCGESSEDLIRRAVDPLRGLTPTMWWPEDRAWFVHSDIDAPSTYIGGSTACIDDVLAAVGIEALSATLTDRFDADGDLKNRGIEASPGNQSYS